MGKLTKEQKEKIRMDIVTMIRSIPDPFCEKCGASEFAFNPQVGFSETDETSMAVFMIVCTNCQQILCATCPTGDLLCILLFGGKPPTSLKVDQELIDKGLH